MLPLPPPPPAGMGFAMPMFRDWVPKCIQPWIYVLCVFGFQFSGGMYLGALEDIQGSTNFMIEDLMMLLICSKVPCSFAIPSMKHTTSSSGMKVVWMVTRLHTETTMADPMMSCWLVKRNFMRKSIGK